MIITNFHELSDSDSEDERLKQQPDQYATRNSAKGNEAAAVHKIKETTGRRILQFVGLAKRLLYAHSTTANLQEEWTGSEPLSAIKPEAIKSIYKLLEPYMPPKDSPRCIMLLLPIDRICNIVQQVSQCVQFNRKISPTISPGVVLSFALDATSTFEMMASISVDENFYPLWPRPTGDNVCRVGNR